MGLGNVAGLGLRSPERVKVERFGLTPSHYECGSCVSLLQNFMRIEARQSPIHIFQRHRHG